MSTHVQLCAFYTETQTDDTKYTKTNIRQGPTV